MTASRPRRLAHHEARERWGQPDESVGSVNDPRSYEEHGIVYNERWTWFLPDGRKRRLYWHRYDCRGALLEAPDGRVEEERI